MSNKAIINDNNNLAPSIFRSLCEFVSDCFGPWYFSAPSEKYLSPKQSPPISHNDLKKDSAQLLLSYWPVSHSARHQRPARERHKICIVSRKVLTTKRRAIQILHISTFQFTFKCGFNGFISKCTDINSLHVTQINLLHNNNTCCST